MTINKRIIFCLTLTISISFTYASKWNFAPDTSKAALKNYTIECEKIAYVDSIIDQAISIGAPTYNDGNHIGCYRIYEGASYKILYKYGTQCERVSEILRTALDKSYNAFTSSEKAWIMRAAFDKILGVPTKTK